MRLIIEIEDKHINVVVKLLSTLKQNIIKNIVIEKEPSTSSNLSKIEKFKKLKAKSNNKIPLNMKIATNTDEMVNDGIF